MDIINTEAGVRAAILRLRRKQTPLRFTFYPMVHLGEPGYYAEISRRLRGHDLIVAEGVQGADASVQRLTSVYRLAGGNKRLGLVVQPQELTDVGVPVIVADMTGEEFGRRWRTIPLTERAVAAGLAPVFGMYLRVSGTREFLARFLREDNDTAIDHWRPDSGIDKLVCDDREAVLLKAIENICEQRANEPIDVAIVYGAGHAIAVVTYLRAALGYVVTSADWVQVFAY